MKSYLLTSVLILLLTLSAAAQTSEPEVYPQQESIDHNDAVKSFSADYVSAFAMTSWPSLLEFNTGTGLSAHVDVEGSQNVTILSQRGYGIIGIADIHGSGNQTNMQQSGFNLSSILSIEGNANSFDMNQRGSGLHNVFRIYGNGATMEAQQTNFGMNYRQTGASTIPLSIQQTGRTTPIIIRNH